MADRQLSRRGSDTRCVGHTRLVFPCGNGMFFSFKKRLVLHLLELLLHSKRPALRPVTPAVSGYCFCDSSGFCGDSWVCEFQTSEHGVNTRMVAIECLRQCCSFLHAQVGGLRMSHNRDPPSPVQLRLPNRFCTLMTKSFGAETLPAHATTCSNHF